MTVLLKEAFERASALPEDAQNELAEELMVDIEAEFRWDKTFLETQDKLEKAGCPYEKARHGFGQP